MSGSPDADGRALVVLGAAGGSGASLVAGALALHDARAGAPSWLVELDLDRGDRADAWDLAPDRTLADLAAVAEELDPGHLARAAHDHDSGVRLLLAPAAPGAAGEWARSDVAPRGGRPRRRGTGRRA